MLTSKQRSYLRALANMENAIIQIGKDSIQDGTVSLVDEALKARELVKVKVLKTASGRPEVLAEILKERLPKTEIVHVLGRVILLYRANENDPIISLP